MNIIEKFRNKKDWLIKRYYPFFWSRILYKRNLGKVTNFNAPKDLNEKIQWLMFYTDTSVWSQLADKYAVRQYVKEKVGDNILIPLLGKWDSAEAIDFENLPEKFVMRPNNGSYDTIICKNKSMVDCEEIRKRMAFSLQHRFGFENAEPHYLKITPCIIAEKLLEDKDNKGLIDYKIWCFNGEPYCFLVCANRNPVTHHADFVYYDINWESHPTFLSEKFRNNIIVPKPSNLDEMISIARRLSHGFPQVRVDLYNIGDKIFFGEMTFSSNFGMMPYYTQEVLDNMGNQCALPDRNLKEKISTFIQRWFPTL